MKYEYYTAVKRRNSVITIQPKDATQKIQATKVDVLHHVKTVSENLQISGVKSDSLNLKKTAVEKLADTYEVKDVSSLSTRVRVSGMTVKLSEQSILNYIISQNKDVISEDFQCNVMRVKSIRKRDYIFQAVLQLDYDIYSKIMSLRKDKLFVGYDVCEVYDDTVIKRCVNCSGSSHNSN
nr:unnamed protein product [Callosobruchus analis]